MIHRFVPEFYQVAEPKIELTTQRGHLVTIIEYPDPNPRDRINDEYDNDDDESQLG